MNGGLPRKLGQDSIPEEVDKTLVQETTLTCFMSDNVHSGVFDVQQSLHAEFDYLLRFSVG